MIDAIGSLLQLLLAALGAVPLPAGLSAGGALGMAALFVAVAVIAIALSAVTPIPGLRSAPHPRRAIDPSTLLAQSDPDADGHPRPRAPGVAPAV
ncbi:DUF6412 domain-containing protein [Microbacterium sp. NPDC058342]|uniref:DUF6412 domain-containing protein n=1 Tax=Microbacterium sp. NPDC058342 TaxID=3346454 RepID=UPI00365A265B